VPRVARPGAPPVATAPPDDTASAEPPPAAAPDPEPQLPWFDRPTQRAPEPTAPEPSPQFPDASYPLENAPRADEVRPEPSDHDGDLFDRRDPPRLELPDESWPPPRPAPRDLDRDVALSRSPEVPQWAWPAALDAAPGAAPLARDEPGGAPKPLALSEPPHPAGSNPPRASAPPAAPPLQPDAARTLGNIRRLMLVSNLFMVVAIGAVLAVVGYRIYRSEPAPAPLPPPAPVAQPASPKIPLDMTLTLPRGARIVATAVAGDRLVLTIEIDGATEIRTFDIKTLQPVGRMSFATVP